MLPLAQRYQVSVARIALAWLLLPSRSSSTVIIGARTMDQLRDHIAATRVKLTAEDLNSLDQVSELPAEYPAWMLAFQGQSRSKPPFRE